MSQRKGAYSFQLYLCASLQAIYLSLSKDLPGCTKGGMLFAVSQDQIGSVGLERESDRLHSFEWNAYY